MTRKFFNSKLLHSPLAYSKFFGILLFLDNLLRDVIGVPEDVLGRVCSSSLFLQITFFFSIELGQPTGPHDTTPFFVTQVDD